MEVTHDYCWTKRRLAEQFAIAARLYAEAVVLLTCPTGGVPRDYGRLLESVEAARKELEDSGAAFQEHVESHRCERGLRGGAGEVEQMALPVRAMKEGGRAGCEGLILRR